MNPVIAWTLASGAFFVLLFGVLSWITNGFIIPFLRVKGSREGLFFVLVRSTLRDYFRIGHIEEGFIVYKKRHSKEITRLRVPEGTGTRDSQIFFRFLGVYWVQVDENKNAIVQIDFNPVSGFDAEKFEGLIKRALYKPSPYDTTYKIILILVVVVLLVGLVNIGMGAYIYKAVKVLQSINPPNLIP